MSQTKRISQKSRQQVLIAMGVVPWVKRSSSLYSSSEQIEPNTVEKVEPLQTEKDIAALGEGNLSQKEAIPVSNYEEKGDEKGVNGRQPSGEVTIPDSLDIDSVSTESLDAKHTDVKQTDVKHADALDTNAESGNSSSKSIEETFIGNEKRSAKYINLSKDSFLVLPNQRQWVANGVSVVSSHLPKQPSQSYLKNGRPSRILSNFLLAIQSILEHETTQQFFARCNIAQVGTTALTDDALESAKVFERYAPRLLLVMGADAANRLTGRNKSINEWQLKCWYFGEEQVPTIVTHHPHDLVSTPLLKKQQYHNLVNFLNELELIQK